MQQTAPLDPLALGVLTALPEQRDFPCGSPLDGIARDLRLP